MTRHVLLVVAAAVCAAPASAQQAPGLLEGFSNDSLEPTGVRLGAFTATPSIKLSEEYNDNFLLLESGEQESFITRVQPELEVRSNFSRHALTLRAGAEAAFFHDSDDDDYLDYFADARGEYDISREARANLALTYRRGSEGRGDVDSPAAAAEPTEFDRFSARLGGELRRGVFRFAPFLQAQALDFDDTDLIGGGQSNEDDRDRVRLQGGLEVGYEFLRGYEAFVNVRALSIDYDDALLDNGQANRDAEGFRAVAGANILLTRLIEASVAAGVETRDFDAGVYDDFTDFTAEASLAWSVTPITTVRAGLGRELRETTIGVASHRVVTGAFAAVSHDIRRNVTLEAAIGYENDDFQGVDRTDDQFSVGVGVEWAANRNTSLEAQYRFTTEDSDAVGESFDVNQLFVSIRYAF